VTAYTPAIAKAPTTTQAITIIFIFDIALSSVEEEQTSVEEQQPHTTRALTRGL
jgi:hypothetical protein